MSKLQNPEDVRETRGTALLVLSVAVVGLVLYFPTLRSSFAYDDIDYFNAAAEHLSGRTPLLSVLFRPQGEHFVPALRLLIAANAWLFGPEALGLRLLVFVSHLASALLLAGVARRYLPSRHAALAAGVAYVLPAGFSSMWVWFPSGGCVPIGLVGITGAMWAIAGRERLGVRKARLLAVAGVLWAVGFENGLVPLVATPALLDEWERRRAGGKKGAIGAYALFCLVLMAVATIATAVSYRQATGVSIGVHPVPAMLRAAYLLLAAPFRLIFPGQHPPQDLGSVGGAAPLLCAYGLVVLLAGIALLAALLVPRSRSLMTAAFLSSAGPLGFVAAVALARSSVSYADLFDSDRYFFPLLIPGALLAGAAFTSLRDQAASWPAWKRTAVWSILGLVLAVELPLHAFAVRRRVPFHIYATHAHRFRQLSRLGELLSARADALPPGAAPLLFPDGSFYFQDVHNGKLTSRFLLYVATRNRSERLGLGGRTVDPRNEAIVNDVLAGWSRELGDGAPAFIVVNGELQDARDSGAVRFGTGPNDAAVVEGFYGWEGAQRWAGPRAVLRLRAEGTRLRLRLATPVSALAAGVPGFGGVRVVVGLVDDSGARVPLGELRLTDDAIADHTLDLPPSVAETVRGRIMRVVLEGTPTWRPRDVLPGTIDERLLTVQVYEAAFEGAAVPGGHSK